MLSQHIRFGFRALRRRPLLSTINLIGLGLAVAVVLMIYRYQRHEWSYDRFHAGADRIYRVVRHTTSETYGDHHTSTCSAYLVDAAQGHLPAVEHMVRFTYSYGRVLALDQAFKSLALHVDPGFFSVFSFPFIAGNPSQALASPSGVVLTEHAARKYFGRTDVLGETLTAQLSDGPHEVQVTGVLKDLPSTTIFNEGDIFLPFSLQRSIMKEMEENNGWGMTYSSTFFKLREGSDAAAVEAQLDTLLASIGQTRIGETEIHYEFQPLTRIYMTARNPRNFPTFQSPTGSYILWGIGLLVVLIACLNYTSLSLAAALPRAKEVGVRKVLGSGTGPLRRQFIVETGILVIVALLLGLILSELLLPVLSRMLQKNISYHPDVTDIAFLALFGIVLVLLAGVYPAAVLSRFPVISSLKKLTHLGGRNRVRSIIVAVQLTISIILISMAFVMRSQMHYIFSRNLGYKGENVVQLDVLNRDQTGVRTVRLLKEELAGAPGVLSIAGASNRFSGMPIWFGWEDEEGTQYSDFRLDDVTSDFVRTMGLEIVDGRDFSPDIASDADNAILVNETLVRKLGWDHPLGQRLPGGFRDHEVIGVLKDYH